LHVAVASDAARPRLTYYDDVSGERVELSAHTLANWVIKTANLLIDDVGVEPGARVSLHLPLHWLAAVWVIAADAVGANVQTPTSRGPEGRLESVVDVETSFGTERFAVSLAPMAMPLGVARPEGTRDFCAEVRTMPDSAAEPLDRPSPLSELASVRAADLGMAPQARVAQFAGPGWTSLDAVVDGLLAPLLVDGSAVWTKSPDATRASSRWSAEQVTAVVGHVPQDLLVPGEIPHLGPSTS
jgi:uncharacterized protein (TIGR03089 family)